MSALYGFCRSRNLTAIYCDEAGNTGASLFDLEQPAFVLARRPSMAIACGA